jgi:hypothetical protein
LSRAIDLLGEFRASLDKAQRHFHSLKRTGMLTAAWTLIGGVGVERVALRKRGLYEPVPNDGELLPVLPVFDGPPPGFRFDPSTLVDLAVWRPRDDTVALRCGNVAALGGWVLDQIGSVFEAPIRIHRSPAAWLLSNADGVVVVDWAAAAPNLLRAGLLVVEDEEHGREVYAELRKAQRRLTPSIPKFAALRGAPSAVAAV